MVLKKIWIRLLFVCVMLGVFVTQVLVILWLFNICFGFPKLEQSQDVVLHLAFFVGGYLTYIVWAKIFPILERRELI